MSARGGLKLSAWVGLDLGLDLAPLLPCLSGWGGQGHTHQICRVVEFAVEADERVGASLKAVAPLEEALEPAGPVRWEALYGRHRAARVECGRC